MSDSEPWLSILVPVYNVAAYLEECLESIRAQLLPGVEVIVIDDASTDDSAQIAARLQPAFLGALKLAHHPLNRGLAATRNELLQAARGRYLWFIDADDMLRGDALQKLQQLVQTQSPDLVMCDFSVLRQSLRLKHRLRGEMHRRTFSGPARQIHNDMSALVAGLLASGQLHSWSKIARREIWQRVKFPEGRYFEDIVALPQLIEGVRTWHYVPEPWIAYRQREGSILAEYSTQKMQHLIQALGGLHAVLLGPSSKLNREAAFSVLHFLLKSHASMARRMARENFAGHAELAVRLKANLDVIFPRGVDEILRMYRRRGWLLRAHRARVSLQRAGLYSAYKPRPPAI